MKWLKHRSEEDFAEEIRSHIEHETDRLVAEGLDPRSARAAAFARFGSVSAARERFYKKRRIPPLDLILKDITLSFRALKREPGFALITILTLAVGIGINSAIFTLLYSLTKRPLPLPDSYELVTVHQKFGEKLMTSGGMYGAAVKTGESSRNVNGSPDMASLEEYELYRAQPRVLAGLAGFASVRLALDGAAPARVGGLLVTCDYFSVLRVRMSLGRTFAASECSRPGDAPVAVLSESLWQRNFAGDRSIIGRKIVLNSQPFTVIGVAAHNFGGTEVKPADLWLPVTTQPLFGEDRLHDGNQSWLALVGRLAPRASLEQARALLTQVARRRDAEFPGRETTVLVYAATRLPAVELQEQMSIATIAAFAIAAFVVLIACLNVANLLLTRAPARQRAVRIRLSLGAGRSRVIGQLLVESLVLGLLGGAAGLLFSMWVPPLVISQLPVGDLQLPFTPDLRVFAWALLVSVSAAIVFGLVPALEAVRVDLATALRGDAAGGGRGPRGYRVRQAIVSAQLAGSLLLLVLAGLFARGVGRAQQVDPGYRVEGVYSFSPDLQSQRYPPEKAKQYYEELRARVAALPGVKSVALATTMPLSGRSMAQFQRGGNPNESASEGPIDYTAVSPEYFAALGIPLVRGSLFGSREPATGEINDVVVSERAAAQFWPGQDALQHIFHLGTTVYRVVGIARDSRHLSISEPDRHFFYAPIRFDVAKKETQFARPQMLIVYSTNPDALPTAVQRLATQLDPSVLLTVQSLQGRIAEALGPARMVALCAGILGFLALLLAVMGVYSAVAYAVNQRWHEIGVRFALGASRRDIVLLVLRQGRSAVVGGILVGLLLAVAAGQVVRGAVYGLQPLDPIAFTGMTALLAAAALLAMVRPAHRAASLDPAVTLRGE